MAVRDPAWEQWFDTQYDLLEQLRTSFKERTKGRSDSFKAAICFGLIEGLSEDARMFLALPVSDGEAVSGTDVEPELNDGSSGAGTMEP